jgi:hypothetical protein
MEVSNMYCEGCGGKLQPHSNLHVDSACDCIQKAERLIDKIQDRIEQDEWEKIEKKRNRKTYVLTNLSGCDIIQQ